MAPIQLSTAPPGAAADPGPSVAMGGHGADLPATLAVCCQAKLKTYHER